MSEGYVVVHNMVDCAHVAQHVVHRPSDANDFGNNYRFEFPCNVRAVDAMALHPALLDAASELLGCAHVELHQAVAWSKAGVHRVGARDQDDNSDQRLHQDFANNTWVVPGDWNDPPAVAAILYYDDVSVTGGHTAVVPRRPGLRDDMYDKQKMMNVRMPGVGGIPFRNDRAHAEAAMLGADEEAYMERQRAYSREVHVCDAKPGSVLFYRLDTWHRGTPVRPGHVRRVHSFVWKRLGECTVIRNSWMPSPTKKLYAGWLERFLATLSTKQLIAIGFPPPWSAYWTSSNTFLVQMRYPDLDLAGYLRSGGSVARL